MAEILGHPWTASVAILLASMLAAWLSRAFVLRRIAALLARTSTSIDDLVLEAVRRHVPLWCLLAGVAGAARVAPIAPPAADLAGRLTAAAFTLSLAFAVAALGAALLRRQASANAGNLAATSLGQNVLRGAILGLGALMVLANLGISITPLLTALGVGSLAVALALQPTLANLFAGIHISASRPIRLGDFVELESGVKGFVEDIGWRSTRLRELPNNLIIVPNSRLIEMVVTNFALPQADQSVVVQVGVAYGSDLARVERVTLEVAREVLRTTPGAVAEFEPMVRYHTFGDSSIGFSVVLRVMQFPDRYLVTHEFLRRLKDRYDREGIEIPFPQRVVHRPPAHPYAPAASIPADAGR